MQTMAIIGFGRFGQLLAEICKADFKTLVVENDEAKRQAARQAGFEVIELQAIRGAKYIFLAVPISHIETVAKQLAPLVSEGQVVIDLCSVKVYPARIMQQYLGHAQLLATHPMFGPDSAKNGLAGLKMAFCPLQINDAERDFVKHFWQTKGVEVIETTPGQHDRDVAYSQAFTYSIAKIVLAMPLPNVTFSIHSFDMLRQVAQLSASDTEQLFHDVLFYNPYFKQMKGELEAAVGAVNQRLGAIADEQRNNPLMGN